MAKKLTVDMEKLSTTALIFQASAKIMKVLLSEAQTSVDTLRTKKWLSPASGAYFDQFSNTWQKGVLEHIQAVEQLAEQMRYAQREYISLQSSAAELSRSLMD